MFETIGIPLLFFFFQDYTTCPEDDIYIQNTAFIQFYALKTKDIIMSSKKNDKEYSKLTQVGYKGSQVKNLSV